MILVSEQIRVPETLFHVFQLIYPDFLYVLFQLIYNWKFIIVAICWNLYVRNTSLQLFAKVNMLTLFKNQLIKETIAQCQLPDLDPIFN